MAPSSVDPASSYHVPETRSVSGLHRTSYTSRSKLSRPAAVAIVAVVAVVLVAAVIASVVMQRRRKAGGSNRAKHHSRYSKGSGSLYDETPVPAPGGEGGQEPYAGAEHDMHPAAGREGGSRQGEAAGYLAGGQYARGGDGLQGRDDGRGGYVMPERPKMSYNPSPAQV